MISKSKSVTAVLGAGSWGSALALSLAQNGHAVRLWGRDPAQMSRINESHTNPQYLPDQRLPLSIAATADLSVAVAGADTVVLTLPSAGVRTLCQALADMQWTAQGTVICAAKGIENDSLMTLDEVIAQLLPGRRVVLLSGPTFAFEIAAGLPAAAVVASRDEGAALHAQILLGTDRFRLYTSSDVAGVAIGGALKNVIAIAAGCADGLGFGANARAALITRGLAEMSRLAVARGADPLTLAGLAGLGDLVLTCTGELSRNRRLGLALATGESAASIQARLGHVTEGVQTATAALALARTLNVDLPITAAVAAVLTGQRTPSDAVAALLAREARTEHR